MLNQFCEFGNHLGPLRGHRPGARSCLRARRALDRPRLRLAGFVSATGSAGTIAAGDRLKEHYGTKIVAVEALECPTLLENGFGEHNIQGIGDKHVPLIHNVMNTDVVVAVSDRATDQLQVLFNTDDGLGYLADRRLVPQSVLGDARPLRPLVDLQRARRDHRRPSCSASAPTTRSSPSPPTGRRCTRASGRRPSARDFGGEFTDLDAAAVFGEHLANVDHRLTPSSAPSATATASSTSATTRGSSSRARRSSCSRQRRSQDFWRGLRRYLGVWDEMITEFNARVACD